VPIWRISPKQRHGSCFRGTPGLPYIWAIDSDGRPGPSTHSTQTSSPDIRLPLPRKKLPDNKNATRGSPLLMPSTNLAPRILMIPIQSPPNSLSGRRARNEHSIQPPNHGSNCRPRAERAPVTKLRQSLPAGRKSTHLSLWASRSRLEKPAEGRGKTGIGVLLGICSLPNGLCCHDLQGQGSRSCKPSGKGRVRTSGLPWVSQTVRDYIDHWGHADVGSRLLTWISGQLR